ncbi:hypothetical protein M634_19870 [Vibrio parahaemolyticus O1:Kuk str. FDA_R31]|nr:hypothetical protein M634_19870 [Vibrio parahaemolyticus O1:Kuk str. FDA_R31]AGQ97235.1 hypothetical protein M636_01025 [Vibrio parahaemolyticus O1:K33 str. CDC_K4557]APC89258.1 hypothetical protein FORC22_3397 [Vibrio parahaemolyticus]
MQSNALQCKNNFSGEKGLQTKKRYIHLDELECPIGYRLGDKLATSERHNM